MSNLDADRHLEFALDLHKSTASGTRKCTSVLTFNTIEQCTAELLVIGSIFRPVFFRGGGNFEPQFSESNIKFGNERDQ